VGGGGDDLAKGWQVASSGERRARLGQVVRDDDAVLRAGTASSGTSAIGLALGGSILSAAGVVPDAFFVLLRFGRLQPAAQVPAEPVRAGAPCP
jgi:hypothetical protein